MKIEYSPKFARLYKKLPKEIKDSAEIKVALFRRDPFYSSLKTHKLTGPLKRYMAFSIDFKHRIVFVFIDSKTVRFYTIGDHSIYQ